jgi:hypothetical protein
MKNKIAHLFLIAAALSITLSCNSERTQLDAKHENLKREAQAEAEKFWNPYIARCGDSIFAFKSFLRLAEFKHLSFYVEEITTPPLTEAERLNRKEKRKTTGEGEGDVEWEGRIKISFSGAHRKTYEVQPLEWKEWSDSPSDIYILNQSVGLRKVDGRWWVYEIPENEKPSYKLLPPEMMVRVYEKIDCSQVSKWLSIK